MVRISKNAKRAFTKNPDVEKAVSEIKEQLGASNDFKLIFFFASIVFPPDKISKEMTKAFPGVPCIGCTTCGELITGKTLVRSVVAIALDSTIVKNVGIELIKDVYNIFDTDKAFNTLRKKFCADCVDNNPENYVGIILSNGLCDQEEKIISRLNELTEVFFVGGTAADAWRLKETYIYMNGEYYTKSAILLLVEPTIGYKAVKTQNFKPLGKVVRVTDADESIRCIKTIDNIPAAEFYAKQIGKPISEIRKHFINYSIGIMVYGEAYVHDIRYADENNHLYMYSAVPKGAEMQVLESTSIMKGMIEFRKREIMVLASVSALLHFCCASRFNKIQLEEEGKDFRQIFEGLPSIGFATYGEFFNSFVNQTSVILIFF